MFVEFVIVNQLFSYSLENFAQILDVPYEGACVFTDRWRLDELAYGIPSDGPYQTNPPSIEDIILSIRIDREGQVRRIHHEEEIDVHDYQILTHEIIPTLKPLEEIIRENSSAFNQPSLSHLNDDDDDGNDEGTSRNILDVPPRPLNPQPLQSLPSLDITLSLSPIIPLENLSSPPSPSPPPPPLPQPPIMGHPLY
ncbi:hypothetical protein Tco_0414799 [Tanacetum coccineum]